MRYGSVCSGIEAASVAWEPLGWSPAWFSEIEAFPSAVLAHHWPAVPNLGDMLNLPDAVARRDIVAPDVLVGGTPCQAFSVAGRRGSLEDERGALSLAYVELANRIDEVRQDDGNEPAIIVWENVPGVLNTRDNAFGCLLAGLAGETEPLQPSGPRWTNAGFVSGPQRAIAWRVLDAQYFGVAQRRRRVFLVASARADFDPRAVLFEREGVRRDTAPRREARQDTARDAGCGAETAGTFDAGAGRVVPARGCFWNGDQVTQTLDAVLHKGQTMPEKNRFPAVIQPLGYANKGYYGSLFEVAVGDPLRAKGGDTGHGGETLAVQAVTGDIAHALNSANNGKGCSADGTGRSVPTIAFSAKDYGSDALADLSPTLRAGGHLGSHANAGVMPAIAYNVHENQRAECTLSDTAGAVKCAGGKPGQGYPAALTAAPTANAVRGLAVRRLMPVECERLQGFPDNHTAIPDWYACRCGHAFPEDLGKYGCPNCCGENTARLKTVADGPRYKAIGNSMAVPCMQWIGARIQEEVDVDGLDLCLA